MILDNQLILDYRVGQSYLEYVTLNKTSFLLHSACHVGLYKKNNNLPLSSVNVILYPVQIMKRH